MHRIIDIIEKTLENKGVSSVFLDIAQAFNRVWHIGMLHKLNSVLPDHFYLLLKSYLTNRHLRVKHEHSYSELKVIKASVPQGRVLGHLLYINNVLTIMNSTMATSADDSEITAAGEIVKTLPEN
jgi:hypothetical protein